MRKKQEFKMINLRSDVYYKLLKAKTSFQKEIGGGKWSFSDVINEYLTISEEI